LLLSTSQILLDSNVHHASLHLACQRTQCTQLACKQTFAQLGGGVLAAPCHGVLQAGAVIDSRWTVCPASLPLCVSGAYKHKSTAGAASLTCALSLGCGALAAACHGMLQARSAASLTCATSPLLPSPHRRVLSDPDLEGNPLDFLKQTEAFWKVRWAML
jgi:hypothetical protein